MSYVCTKYLICFSVGKRAYEKSLRRVGEWLLFHGMSPSHVADICMQNFHWRICGIHETMYGKSTTHGLDLHQNSWSVSRAEGRAQHKLHFLLCGPDPIYLDLL